MTLPLRVKHLKCARHAGHGSVNSQILRSVEKILQYLHTRLQLSVCTKNCAPFNPHCTSRCPYRYTAHSRERCHASLNTLYERSKASPKQTYTSLPHATASGFGGNAAGSVQLCRMKDWMGTTSVNVAWLA